MKYEGTIAVAPPQDRMAEWLEQAMLWLLAFFVFALPLVEAPKNLAGGLFIAAWLAYGFRTRDFGGAWNLYDTVFLFVLSSGVLSGLMGYAGDLGGVFRVVLLAWVVSRAPLRRKDLRVVTAASCVGLLLGIPFAAVPLLRGTREYFELPSVGQVNQSALYVAILAIAAFGWWLQLARSGVASRARTGFAVSAAVMWLALLVSASRGAIVAALPPVLLIAAAVLWYGRRSGVRKLVVRAAAILGVLLVLVAALTAWAPQMSDRKLTPERLFATSSMSHRMHHWRLAYEGWRERPWIGWGPDAFQRLTVDDVCEWRAKRGEGCDRDLYVPTKHAHSLYMSTLSERGVLGVAALALLLGAWAWSLVRSRRTAATSPMWPASLAGLAVVVIGGVFNTTLRVEHGSIALAFFGLWIAVHARRAATARG
jgi:O-antigen ligase